MTKIFLVKLDSSTIQTVEEQFFFSFETSFKDAHLKKA